MIEVPAVTCHFWKMIRRLTSLPPTSSLVSTKPDMSLFSGQACFSPFVSREVILEWTKHGGTVSPSRKEKGTPDYFFCAGKDDPRLLDLAEKSIVVFHCAWILQVARAHFVLPITRYVLNACYSAPTRPVLGIPGTERRRTVQDAQEMPVATHRRPTKRPFSPDDVPQSSIRPRKRVRLDAGDQAASPHDHRQRRDQPLRSKSASRLADVNLCKLSLPKMKREDQALVYAKLPQRAYARRTSALKNLLSEPSNCTSETSQRIAVSVALGTLRAMDATEVCAVKFLPGIEYLGKKFRCFRPHTSLARS
ncbi:hypothetical protein OBBRIDRAFT_648065 [Obba rivulosa]|uniref:BRCT domain-containing protein n=1 Tax=Obba rivulosa TaxID=1052685 RepID=A0A8E2ASW3_9APHY|nr:hypothetical protein OBBRIDRAFT_648065 [Obba rivulosa]